MWWTADRQSYAVSVLVNGGLSPWGAAGLVSRWVNVEAPNGPASRGGYQGRAWGIGQWLGPRLPPIDGNPNFDDQLAYVIQELVSGSDGSNGQALARLRSASDANSGAIGASTYERASGYNKSTGVDDYTWRTAAGAPAVFQNWQGVLPVNANYDDGAGNIGETVDASQFTDFSPSVPGSIGIGGVVIVAVALVLVFCLIE